MGKYYDGRQLLSKKDLNGSTPEIFMTTTNRTGGKTTFFSKFVVDQFLTTGSKFVLIKRFEGQLKSMADAFFKDINSLFFPGMEMTEKYYRELGYTLLILNGNPCGYGLALNSADKIKPISHLFSDAGCVFFDEFQSETNHYCPDEIRKFQSVHTSIARGQGEQVRYVPVYMAANPVTLLNPYYNAMGISARLRKETRFLRGNGFVLEQGFIESACEAQKTSGFNQAFASQDYGAYSAEAVYLNDSSAFISKPNGRHKYCFTIKYKNKHFGVYEYLEEGVVYCCQKANMQHPTKLVLTTQEHNINYVMLQKNEILIGYMRQLFDRGCFRFSDLEAKECILKMLSYY